MKKITTLLLLLLLCSCINHPSTIDLDTKYPILANDDYFSIGFTKIKFFDSSTKILELENELTGRDYNVVFGTVAYYDSNGNFVEDNCTDEFKYIRIDMIGLEQEYYNLFSTDCEVN